MGEGQDFGCYWPVELDGYCYAYWSTDSKDNDDYFMLEVDFSRAKVSNISRPSGLRVRCVRDQ